MTEHEKLEHEYYSCDYNNPDGSRHTTTFHVSLCHKYLALYGKPAVPWRPATEAEIAALRREDARLEALNG
jgi:hypothetical protein